MNILPITPRHRPLRDPVMPAPPHAIPTAFGPGAKDPWIDLRRELMDWAEPVIADCIFHAYRARDVDASRARFLSSQHRRLWRAILLEHRGIMNTLWNELNDDLSAAGMATEVAQAIDQNVFEELFDIVLKRFRSSSEKAKGCSMILLGAASYMGASRALQ